MKIGERINTSLGELLILDIQDNYLILFNEYENKFIKANGYQEDYEKVFWNNGEYYFTLHELIENL